MVAGARGVFSAIAYALSLEIARLIPRLIASLITILIAQYLGLTLQTKKSICLSRQMLFRVLAFIHQIYADVLIR